MIDAAARDAEKRYRHGRTRFYIATGMLVVLSLVCGAVAVVYGLSDEPDANEAVGGAAVGMVVCPLLLRYGIRKLARAAGE